MIVTAKRKLPRFASEAEEADWWYEHRDEITQDWIEARPAVPRGERVCVRYVFEDAEEPGDASER